jgi:hypothetical protein
VPNRHYNAARFSGPELIRKYVIIPVQKAFTAELHAPHALESALIAVKLGFKTFKFYKLVDIR